MGMPGQRLVSKTSQRYPVMYVQAQNNQLAYCKKSSLQFSSFLSLQEKGGSKLENFAAKTMDPSLNWKVLNNEKVLFTCHLTVYKKIAIGSRH